MTKDNQVARLAVLFHHRWNVPVLSELYMASGAKFVTLVNRLGVSRDSLRHTLDNLIQKKWIIKNPGYGHPMRPEYVLTPRGKELASRCVPLMELLSSMGMEDVAQRKWSMPVASALRQGRIRFSELKANIPGLTPRALTLALKSLLSAGLVERLVSDDYPPATHYRLTQNGQRLARVLNRF